MPKVLRRSISSFNPMSTIEGAKVVQNNETPMYQGIANKHENYMLVSIPKRRSGKVRQMEANELISVQFLE